jgi:UPF0755 protein
VSKKTLLVLIFVFLVFAVPALLWFWYQKELSPVVVGNGTKVSFTVSPNETAVSVLKELQKNSLIRSGLATRIYLKINGLGSKIRPGIYVLEADTSTPEIIKSLSIGPKDIRVTFPEGWRREEIASRLASVLIGPTTKFNPSDFIKETAALEGRLFPDTYLLPADISTDEVADLLTANFSKKTGLVPTSDIDKTTLILASLVEREAKSESDRQTIASILKKRLLAGWPLQVDASVQYSMDNRNCAAKLLDCNWWRNPIVTDYPSAFNTYLHPGLPPAPICNPGLATIDAVKNASDSAYWYYMTDNDGITHYARTLAEHNLNIDKYLLH